VIGHFEPAVQVARALTWALALIVQSTLGAWIVPAVLLVPDTGAWVSRGIAAALLTAIWAAGAWLIARRLRHRIIAAWTIPLVCLAASAALLWIGVAIAALAAVRGGP